jgi:TPR repeat protein
METLDVFPVQRRMVAIPLPQMSLRSRREVSALDQINSLHVEQWQTDGPQLQNDRPAISNDEIKERTKWLNKSLAETLGAANGKNAAAQSAMAYRYSLGLGGVDQDIKMAQFWKEKATEGGFAVHRRGAYTFMDMNPINTRTTDRNYLQNQQYVADANQLGQNPYFERFDVVTDPFNVARELRATVYEDKVDRGLLESKRLLNRIYTTRYKAPDYAEKNSLDTLNSYEDLRPRLNTMEKTYRPYKN